jgi:N-acetylglucosaminyldiphosphoundecaprenol N-acetyl-beta-D-mannosaminyltransferase
MRTRVRIGHVSIDALRFDEAVNAIDELVARGQGGMVFTPNVDHVVIAEEDVRFRSAYEAADLSLVDGVPVLWASRILGRPLPEKVSGADLVRPLAARAAERQWRVYFLGARDGVGARARAILEREYPGLNVVGASAPNIDLDSNIQDQADVLAPVQTARPHLLFLALGAPKQEVWAHRIRDLLRPTVILGVGASLDFIAGVVKRAPPWVSVTGFEWLYRLAHEPRRLWKRYLLRDPKFLAIVLREAWPARP